MKKVLLSATMTLVALFGTVTIGDQIANAEVYFYYQEEKGPEVLNYYPVSSVEPVALDQTFKIEFNKEIQLGDKEIAMTYGGGNIIPLDISIDGRWLIIKPKTSLMPGYLHHLTIPKGAILDLDGNPTTKIYGNAYTAVRESNQTQQPVSTTPSQPVGTIQPSQPIQSAQSVTLANQQTMQQVKEIIVIEKGKSMIFQINGQPAPYAIWTSNPNVATVEVKDQQLIVTGTGEGYAQIAIRNTVNNNKVVFEVKVVQSLINL